MLYDKWSRYEPETRGVLVAYASIYGGTAEAARRLAAMLRDRDAGEVVLFDLLQTRPVLCCGRGIPPEPALPLCSVTCDGALFPAMHSFIHHLAGKNLRGRRVAVVENGSWTLWPASACATCWRR